MCYVKCFYSLFDNIITNYTPKSIIIYFNSDLKEFIIVKSCNKDIFLLLLAHI